MWPSDPHHRFRFRDSEAFVMWPSISSKFVFSGWTLHGTGGPSLGLGFPKKGKKKKKKLCSSSLTIIFACGSQMAVFFIFYLFIFF